MGIQSRSILQQEAEKVLERSNPQKILLIRANQPNCSACFINGRNSINQNCATCAGTGYLGVSFDGNGNQIVTATGLPFDDTKPPASIRYAIYGDIQMGHGLYGSGGDFVKLIADLGRQDVGDGTLFCKYQDRDRQTGNIIYPIVSSTQFRPDRVISKYGEVYNVFQEIILDTGSEVFYRAYSLSKGQYTTQAVKK